MRCSGRGHGWYGASPLISRVWLTYRRRVEHGKKRLIPIVVSVAMLGAGKVERLSGLLTSGRALPPHPLVPRRVPLANVLDRLRH
jgi:hypothetical protein